MYKRILAIAVFIAIFFPITRISLGEGVNTAQFLFEAFKKIPILENGRVKPLDTYAQNILLLFSGKRTFERRPAIEWLARLLFSPQDTQDDKIFLINNPEVVLALNVIPDPHRRYSFKQMEKGYHKLSDLAMQAAQIDEKKRTIVENEILNVFANINLYLNLTQSFQFALAHPDFEIKSQEVRQYLNMPSGQTEFSFVDIALKADRIQEIANKLDKKDAGTWTNLEKGVFTLLSNLYQWSTHYQSMPFHVIAPFTKNSEIWLSPWDAIGTGFQNNAVHQEIVFLRDMALAYENHDAAAFNTTVNSFCDSVKRRSGDIRSLRYISLEVLNNKLKPFFVSQILYLFSFILLLVSFFVPKTVFYRASFGLVIFGFIPHLFAIVSRIVILARPPISSLYETFIFVSFVAVGLGILIEVIQKKKLGILVSSFCGTALLILASKFSSDGDTMKMLVAVLNSNFWLSVHVPNITMGYAACCVAGIVGHVYIIQSLLKSVDRKQLESTYRVLLGALGLGLTLAFFGTMLGGIWADQSWGRFWGWDPKENGALMIVLWCALIFHAKIAKLIDALGVAVLSAMLLLVVMWAWFGVNLLSVGLHSYGFTSGVAVGFGIYIAGETVFLLITTPLAYKKLNDSNS